MSVRSFTFCDLCNPMGVRCPEERRGVRRGDAQGRRVTDGRAWIEGDAADAAAAGWLVSDAGEHLCPRCREHREAPRPPHLAVTQVSRHASTRSFLFCDVCNAHGVRYIEQRRNVRRGHEHGRRLTDGRAWYEGPVEAAISEEGWVLARADRHVCPRCQQRHDASSLL